jgi:Skp family chaperone for outer membrane proteins
MRFMNAMCAVAAIAAAITLTPDASAQRRNNQATTVVVVNYQRVLTESALGRDMAAKLQQVRTEIATEGQALAPEGQSIEQERQRLATATRNMTPDQVRASTTYAPQFQALQGRLDQYERRGRTLQGDFECTQAIALRDFNQTVSPMVRSAMESRGAGVVLDASNIQFVQPEFDVTTTIIQQLDQNNRTMNVTRRQLAECQPQQAAPPPAQ